MKSSRISRVVKILTTLQSGRQYSPADLEKMLGISRRTVFRDLKELQAIGVPYKYDTKSGGYSIDPTFFLPPMDFTLPEALSLLTAVYKMRNHIPTPFRNNCLLAGLKIENNLPADIRKYCQLSLQNVTIAPEKHANILSLDRLYGSIQKSIKCRNKIELEYNCLTEFKKINTYLHPYHLLYKNRSWYVIGFSQKHNAIRTFNLVRIDSLAVKTELFTEEELKKFDLTDYIGKAWSLIPEGRLYNIRLRFSPMVAKNVAEVQWHSSQQVKFYDDGWADVSFRVDGLGEISWWVAGYGDQVQIVAPAALRQKVLQRAENLINMHKHL